MKQHHYAATITWTGNKGDGTKDVRSYERDHTIEVAGKPPIAGTSEVSMQGNRVRYNPEELLLSALSACHMLWYLYLCAGAGIVVTEYIDAATSTMQSEADGSGRFTEVVLQPTISIASEVSEVKLNELQQAANRLCFIAASCNFPVRHQPEYLFTTGNGQ